MKRVIRHCLEDTQYAKTVIEHEKKIKPKRVNTPKSPRMEKQLRAIRYPTRQSESCTRSIPTGGSESKAEKDTKAHKQVMTIELPIIV